MEKPYTEELLRRTNSRKKSKLEIKPSSKSELIFKYKPKIPKSGKSLYRGFYIRKLQGFEIIYYVATALYVVMLPKHIDAREFIDNREEDILRRVSEVDI